jgi:hypothetical protein
VVRRVCKQVVNRNQGNYLHRHQNNPVFPVALVADQILCKWQR